MHIPCKDFHRLLHATLLRISASWAVFHFISQTLLRVQRYRIYLILCGGMGLALVAAGVLRLDVVQEYLALIFRRRVCWRQFR
jgi:hypothetical protein